MGIKNILKIVWLILVPFIFFIPDNVVAQTGTDGVDQACPCGSDGAGTLCWACPVTSTPPPPSGGGWGYTCPWSPVNCANGYATDASYTTSITGAHTGRCPIGSAQTYTCTMGNTYDGDGNEVCAGGVVNTYNCCPAGTTAVGTQQAGSTYTTSQTYDTGLGNPTPNCGQNTYISHYPTSCYYGNKWGEPNAQGQYYWCTQIVTCQYPPTTVYSCQVTCTPSYPSAPSLVSPSPTGVTLSTTTNNLDWSTTGQTWGTGCPSNNNNYYVYLGSNVSSMALVGTFSSASGISIMPITRSAGTYHWKVVASNGSRSTDSQTWSFTISDAEPWWQVKDGDVTTNRDLYSEVSDGRYFDVAGNGGFPGVPVYGDGFNLINNTLKISVPKWHANTATTQSRIFNYAYFENLVPNNITINDISFLPSGTGAVTDIQGYEWYKATGDVSTSGDITIGDRKVILFIENGNFNINGKINLTDGVGFFGVFVDGNIVVNPTVAGAPSIEGVYLSNGSFSTGAGTSRLHVRGSIATFGNVNLQRDQADNITSAELFEFAPDQMLLFPEKLMFRRTKWTEVAP